MAENQTTVSASPALRAIAAKALVFVRPGTLRNRCDTYRSIAGFVRRSVAPRRDSCSRNDVDVEPLLHRTELVAGVQMFRRDVGSGVLDLFCEVMRESLKLPMHLPTR